MAARTFRTAKMTLREYRCSAAANRGPVRGASANHGRLFSPACAAQLRNQIAFTGAGGGVVDGGGQRSAGGNCGDSADPVSQHPGESGNQQRKYSPGAASGTGTAAHCEASAASGYFRRDRPRGDESGGANL